MKTLISLSAILLGAMSAPAATPLPSLEADAWPVSSTREFTGASPIPSVEPPATPAESPEWRLGVHYFQGTSNSLGDIFSGEINTLSQNGIRLTAARMLVNDLWNTPINILAEVGLMWHNEQGKQSDVFQYTFGFVFEWDRFPWDEHLRTRFGVTTGVSYVDSIPITEQVNRGTTSSSHLLHYLDFSLAFNCADISRLTRLELLFPGRDSSPIDHVWLTFGLPHRSGAWGAYGDDRTGNPITGGSNYLSIGIEADF